MWKRDEEAGVWRHLTSTRIHYWYERAQCGGFCGLHGAGAPVDITSRHSTACSDPFTLCIAFNDGQKPTNNDLGRLALRFVEREGRRRVLGEIGLRQTACISLPGMEVVLFRARSAANHCLPALRLSAHYLLQAYALWRAENTSGMRMSFLDRRAAIVTFIRPHPVMLVSVAEGTGGNMFPMNLMGELGPGRLAFALKDSRRAAHLVERVGRAALSSVPVSQAAFAFRLAVNHFKDSIAWDELPFPKKKSAAFDIPVPAFALRVREVEVEKVHRIGSHTLFIARVTHDERLAEAPQLLRDPRLLPRLGDSENSGPSSQAQSGKTRSIKVYPPWKSPPTRRDSCFPCPIINSRGTRSWRSRSQRRERSGC